MNGLIAKTEKWGEMRLKRVSSTRIAAGQYNAGRYPH